MSPKNIPFGEKLFISLPSFLCNSMLDSNTGTFPEVEVSCRCKAGSSGSRQCEGPRLLSVCVRVSISYDMMTTCLSKQVCFTGIQIHVVQEAVVPRSNAGA